VTEVGCLAHARRKFQALHVNHQSEVVGEALELHGALYGASARRRTQGSMHKVAGNFGRKRGNPSPTHCTPGSRTGSVPPHSGAATGCSPAPRALVVGRRL
jgi:hypothetical protein